MSALPKRSAKKFKTFHQASHLKSLHLPLPQEKADEKHTHNIPPPFATHTSRLGIPPIFPAHQHPQRDWRMVDARQFGGKIQGNGPLMVRSSLSHHVLNTPLLHRFINRFIDNWIIQEFWFAMNKLSILGLVTGLMFLGAIFFGVGFLTAYQTIPSTPFSTEPTSWTKGIQSYGPPPPQGQPIQTASHGVMTGLLGGVIGNQIHNIATGPVGKISGVMGAAQSKVPAPFQPFVNYGANRVNQNMVMQTQRATQFSTDQTQHMFSPQGLARSPVTSVPVYPSSNGAAPQLQNPPSRISSQTYGVYPQNGMPPQQQNMQHLQSTGREPMISPPPNGPAYTHQPYAAQQQNMMPPSSSMAPQYPTHPMH